MTDHQYGRREYDNAVLQTLGRIEGVAEATQREVGRLHARLDGFEVRVGLVERTNAEMVGATRERGRWTAVAGAVGTKLIPAGGGIAGLLALWHALGGQTK